MTVYKVKKKNISAIDQLVKKNVPVIIVKNFINKYSSGKNIIRKLPITNINQNILLKKIKIPLKATEEEIQENIRSRSARLRVAERI